MNLAYITSDRLHIVITGVSALCVVLTYSEEAVEVWEIKSMSDLSQDV